MSSIASCLLNLSRNHVLSNLSVSFKSIILNTNALSKPKLFPLVPVLLNKSASSLATTIAPKKDLIQQSQKSNVEIFKNVNNLILNQSEGRLFAVVQILGKQFKITAGDIILVEGYWPPTIGDRIRLDKVLLAGGRDFTLIGRPLLDRNLIDVQATIIEKTLTHTKTHFIKHKRKQYMRINFYRLQNTMIRINSIEIKDKINQKNISNENNLKLF